tara:strand:- start:366 stop:746 length:381 start_codon:yes stop_codon:yes gene_type:complete
MNRYFPDDIWNIIKDYLIHNITKHGKHLKNDIWINIYNQCLTTIFPIIIPRYGSRVVYYQNGSKRFVKFIYKFPRKYDDIHSFFYKCISIIEIQLLPEDYDNENITFDHKLRYDYYHKNGKTIMYQ